jgi:hypothetical protein
MNSHLGRLTRSLSIISLCLILGSTISCGTLEMGVELTPTYDLNLRQTMNSIQAANARLATLIANPNSSGPSLPASDSPPTITLTPTLTKVISTSTPTSTHTPGPPKFSSLYFSTQPDGPSQRYFPAGIQRIYAIWKYENMNVGMIVHREWKKDEELWSDRYETWDFPRYGAEGTKKDTFIYDFDYGLQPGHYSFSLEINGVMQPFASGDEVLPSVSFWVIKGEINTPILSPNRAYSLSIQWGGRLIIRDPDGNFRDLVVTNEIPYIAWFPDNRHIIYADRDRTKQLGLFGDIGITHQLWILDVITGERYMIGSADENFHHPLLSLDGQYIAVMSGSNHKDACQASPLLVFIELDQELHRKAVYQLKDFAGLPYAGRTDVSIYLNDPQRTGSWEDAITFTTYLRWTCIEEQDQTDGFYLLKLDKLQASRLADQ